jgi:hypothetical protein
LRAVCPCATHESLCSCRRIIRVRPRLHSKEVIQPAHHPPQLLAVLLRAQESQRASFLLGEEFRDVFLTRTTLRVERLAHAAAVARDVDVPPVLYVGLRVSQERVDLRDAEPTGVVVWRGGEDRGRRCSCSCITHLWPRRPIPLRDLDHRDFLAGQCIRDSFHRSSGDCGWLSGRLAGGLLRCGIFVLIGRLGHHLSQRLSRRDHGDLAQLVLDLLAGDVERLLLEVLGVEGRDREREDQPLEEQLRRATRIHLESFMRDQRIGTECDGEAVQTILSVDVTLGVGCGARGGSGCGCGWLG